jgi:glucosamine kinase
MNDESNSLIVAVDGGGSTCRVSICEPSGDVIGTALGESANITTDFNIALSNIMDTIHRAYLAAGLRPTRMVNDFAYLGLAGANLAGMATRTENALNFRQVKVTSDREITVQGAMGGGDGTVAAIGTGSFFVSRQNEAITSIGGWGFQLGDDCGGAFLGRKLLRRTIHAYDGIVPHSPLTRKTLERFGGTPQGLVAFVQAASPMDYGGFAPGLIEAYYAGDVNAVGIVESATELLHQTLDVLNTKATGALYLLGGLGPVYEKLLRPEYQKLCVVPKGTASEGAFALALRLWAGELE